MLGKGREGGKGKGKEESEGVGVVLFQIPGSVPQNMVLKSLVLIYSMPLKIPD